MRALIFALGLSGLTSLTSHAHVSSRWLSDLKAPGVSGALGVQSVGYLYGDGVGSQSAYTGLRGELVARSSAPWFETRLDLEGMTLLNAKGASYFEAPEAYAGIRPAGGPVLLGVGRKLIAWNRSDDPWGFGLWQPRFRWDYVRPRSVGLLGFYGEWGTPSTQPFQLTLFGSPISIPERGVPIETDGGRLVSNTPWFIPPISSVRFNGVDTPLRYSLNTPPLRELILKPTIAARMRVGGENGLWGAVAYANKPINQVMIGADGAMQLSPGSSVVQLDLYPRILRHELLTVESGFDEKDWSFWASSTYESPERDNPPATWTTQEISRALLLTAGGEVRFRSPLDSRVGLSVLRALGGDAPDQGPDARAGRSYFESRYPFRQALMVMGETQLPGGFSFMGRFIGDMSYRGSLISSELRYRVRTGGWMGSSLMLNLGIDVLGTQSDAPQDNLISRYRSNDRIYGGLTYVF